MNYAVLKTILHNEETFVAGQLIKLEEAIEASVIEALIEVGAIAPDPVPEPIVEKEEPVEQAVVTTASTDPAVASAKKSKATAATDATDPAAAPAAAV